MLCAGKDAPYQVLLLLLNLYNAIADKYLSAAG
jgi:hypothetical protein